MRRYGTAITLVVATFMIVRLVRAARLRRRWLLHLESQAADEATT